MKGRILQLNTSLPLKCGTGCLFIKLTLGRVGMGQVLHLGPSWHGPSFMWAELAWAELVLGRVVLHPSIYLGPSINRLVTDIRVNVYIGNTLSWLSIQN